MAKVDMAALRAKLLEKNKNTNNDGERKSTGDNASFAFWNMPFDTTSVARFLPDADESNSFFWADREVMKFPFEGVVGGDYPTDKQVLVQVPCVDMFPGMKCPITAEMRPWWKDERKPLAQVYYKKRSYIFQGFVVTSSLAEDDLPENPIRRFVINPSIYTKIKEALMDEDMEDAPTDYDGGVDFKISKIKKGDYANYDNSSWARKPRSLTESERGAIEQYGLYTLKDYCGRVPDSDEMEAIKAMFQDSLAGKPFDVDSYGKWFRAFPANRGGEADDLTEAARAAAAQRASKLTPAREVEEAVSETEVQAPKTSAPASAPVVAKPDAQAMLQKIRDRQKS